MLWKPLSRELVAAIKTATAPEEIDAVIERYIENDDGGAIKLCGEYCEGDLLFQETVTAFNMGLYNVAIVGFMAVFDRVMSECSGLLNDVNFRRRMEELEKRINAMGDIYIDDLETKDYLLFITYFEAVKGIGDGRDFDKDEPMRLSRPWVAHGRSNRNYTKIDCIKVVNMIYGTIRMDEIGKVE